MPEPQAIAEPRASLVTAGQVLGAKYRVDRPIACGGMGVVWAATHIELGHRVAIKVLSIEGSNVVDVAAATRFRREARSGARLRSEHICRVLDAGAVDDVTPFLVMEYLEGRDVGDLLEARRRLSVDEVANIAYQACLGLIEAHAAGIVHRDLKPSNLFLARQPDGTELLKLLDFGISKNVLASERPTQSLTQTATLLGSPLYMSPEQLNSAKDVDARSDVWAMGVIMYELVTGSMPFEGENLAKLILAALSAEPVPFESVGIQVPPAFNAIVQRCLRKAREDRFSSARELADALAALIEEPVARASRWQLFARRVQRASGVVRVRRTSSARSRRTLFGVSLLAVLTLAVWSYALAIGPFRAQPAHPSHAVSIDAVRDAPAAASGQPAPPPRPPMAAEPAPTSSESPAPKRTRAHKLAAPPAPGASDLPDFGGRR